jgi:Fe-S cluster biogenesis protein NfuA
MEFDETPNPNYSSDLANEFLQKDYITSVFFGYDFISITKTDQTNWDIVSSDIILTIMQYEDQIKNLTLIKCNDEGDYSDEKVECDECDLNIVQMIVEFLNDVIRPQIAMDGGDIQLVAYKNKIAYLKLKGACSSCPSSTQTLYHGVREMLITNIPEVMDIEQIY